MLRLFYALAFSNNGSFTIYPRVGQKTRLFSLLLTSIYITALLTGCNSNYEINESLYWNEVQGNFYTNDISRAQKEIPFPLIVPTYFPEETESTPIHIVGPLRIFQDDNPIRVEIYYRLYPEVSDPKMIIITERDYPIVPEDPNLNPDFQYIEIGGKKIIKTEGNFGPGIGVIFYFNNDGIYFVVEAYNISVGEATKVVESMIKQFK